MLKVGKILAKINNLEDFKKLNTTELNNLAEEIRQFIIDKVSKTGGHLASNLGVVELTIALHRVFNSPKDKIIWDVGHQAYVHKILTGRKDEFDTLRQFNGLSGFPKRNESEHDIFETGHSSTSISAGLGFALSRDVKNDKNDVISIIGDGAMTAGMAFEALNHIGEVGTKQIVVLNDNEMSISENVGGLSKYLSKITTTSTYSKVKEDLSSILNSIPAIGKKVYKTAEKAKDSVKYFLIPGMLFEDLGLKYIGPVDGHNIQEVISALYRAKNINGPTLVHVITKKGKGYLPAEKSPDKYHGASPFKIETGESVKKTDIPKYSNILGESLVELACENDDIVAITAAMPAGTGLAKFHSKFPKRFFDVGIAEQHGVTLAAGLASNGLKPFFAVYSTFLQRGYDQVLHDVCIQNLPVVFAIDRAGLVGNDGETHHGVFDLSFLSHMPNMTIMAPKDRKEMKEMIKFAASYNKGPLAIRYPRGVSCDMTNVSENYEVECGKGEVILEGKDIAILAVGKMVDYGYNVAMELKEKGKEVTLVNGRFIKPLDEQLILDIAKNHKLILTYEDNVVSGGFGNTVNSLLIKNNYKGKVLNIGLPDEFIEHGAVELLYSKYKLDVNSVVKLIEDTIN